MKTTIEKKRTKYFVFKIAARKEPKKTPKITKNPKIFKILKSTALCFLCVRTEAVEVNIVMKNAVPTAKCIV